MNTRVYLSQPALVNALGQGADAMARALFAGHTGGMVAEAGHLPHAPERWLHVGRVQAPLPTMPPTWIEHNSRNNRLLLLTAQLLADRLKHAVNTHGPDRIGVVLGTSTSGIGEAQAALAAQAATGALPVRYHYTQQELGSPALFLAHWLGLGGPTYTVSTACTSSAKAFGSARRLLRAGLCDAVVVGGVDALCPLTLNGFTALASTAPDLMNPMSLHRQGINLGEGAALFLMGREPDDFELLGVGESSDAHHISSPDPSGAGAEQAMRAALRDAGVLPDAIGYLNLHATATPKNDAMESLAVARVFGTALPCSGTKPLTGHLLGAAGATELAFCALALTHHRLPPHRWDGMPDPELPVLNLVADGHSFTGPQPRTCMSNSFAFGGSNASLVIGDPR